MMTSSFIVDVTEADFEYEVIAFSQEAPVVVDFWAEWCGPCKMIGPVLEKLAIEAQGGFRLAKVNVDENPRLAVRFGVTGIPAVKAFRNQQIVAEFAGVRPEPALREFVQALAPTQADLALEKGFSLLDQQQAAQAANAFREALAAVPGKPEALLGLSRALLLQGGSPEALSILQRFPPSRSYNSAQILLPLAQALQGLTQGDPFSGEDPLDPAYENALRLVRRGNFEAAMDGLLDILRENKRYRDGLARKVMLGLLETLGEGSPVTRSYRSELALVLF
jgi:putative thioredoxin